MRTTLLHDRAAKLSKAKAHVYSDSALCLGKTDEPHHSMKKWKGQIGWFIDILRTLKNRMEFDGEPVEFEWNTFAGHTTLDLLHEIQRMMAENRIKLEEFEDRIIFMSMYNDIDWTTEGTFKKCISQARRFLELLCRNDDAQSRRKRTSRISSNKCVGPRNGGKLPVHYNGDLSNAELLFRTITSVNQLSAYGAISDWCEELAQQISDHIRFPARANPKRRCMKSWIVDSPRKSCRL